MNIETLILRGNIHDVKAYDRVLSREEIDIIHNEYKDSIVINLSNTNNIEPNIEDDTDVLVGGFNIIIV